MFKYIPRWTRSNWYCYSDWRVVSRRTSRLLRWPSTMQPKWIRCSYQNIPPQGRRVFLRSLPIRLEVRRHGNNWNSFWNLLLHCHHGQLEKKNSNLQHLQIQHHANIRNNDVITILHYNAKFYSIMLQQMKIAISTKHCKNVVFKRTEFLNLWSTHQNAYQGRPSPIGGPVPSQTPLHCPSLPSPSLPLPSTSPPLKPAWGLGEHCKLCWSTVSSPSRGHSRILLQCMLTKHIWLQHFWFFCQHCNEWQNESQSKMAPP